MTLESRFGQPVRDFRRAAGAPGGWCSRTVPEMPPGVAGGAPASARRLAAVGAVTRSRADARVVAAGVRAFGIDAAEAGLVVQIEAVAVGQPGQGEDFVLVVEVLDDAGLAQA